MVFVKMYLRVSRRSAVATSSAPVPGVCSRFVAVVCSAPVPGVSFAITSSDFQDPVDSHLFHHREGYFVLRHSIGSTASTCSSAISPPVNVNQSSGASRAVKSADYLVSIHTPLFIESVVRVTRSTTSTGYPPISPPVVVNQASGASRAVTSVESLDLVQSPFFFQPDRFRISLGCSTGRCTAASMVIAHKVGRCTGKASLYAWNSFFPEDFSSVSVYLRRFTSVIVNDLVTDFVMDSYILFPGFYELLASTGMVLVNDKIFGENPWLDLKLQLLLLYGSLPRPPESCSVSCSWHRFNTLVCYRMDSADSYRHQNLSRQGERLQDAVDSCCVYLCEADCYGLLIFKSLACEVDVMMLLNLGGLQVLTPLVDGSFRDLYVTADTAMVPHSCYWFSSISLAKKHVDAILGTAAATVGTLMDDFSSVYKPLLGASILRLISEQRFLQVFLHLQSQNYRFFRGISLAISGRFGLLTAIPYGSLPRPPEDLSDVNFSPLRFICSFLCPRCNGLHLEGEY